MRYRYAYRPLSVEQGELNSHRERRFRVKSYTIVHCCAVGIEVKAVPMKRRPRTATLPEVTVTWADPRLPATPDSPEILRKNASVLEPAAKATEDVPITAPELFHTVRETVTGNGLGFAMATAVIVAVSSQLRMLPVDVLLASGTTAS
jgi:hypothetical protein